MALIETWLGYRGYDTAHAMATVNAALDRRYTSSRLSEWRRSIREIPSDVRAFMFEDCLQEVLTDVLTRELGTVVCLPPNVIKRIVRALT